MEELDNDKVFYWVGVKLNLGNYNSVEIKAGRVASVPQDKNPEEIMRGCIELVDRVIMQKQEEWANRV